MNAEGQLADIDFTDMLVELWRDRFTGAVRAESDAIIKIIYFREGDLLSASTNDRGDSLGEILLRHGKVTREHLKSGVAKRKEEESLGEALLGMGFISRRELLWARRTQLVGALRSVIAWESGDYNIIADYVPRREEGAPFSFPQVILEVILTRTDRDHVDRELELGSLVFARLEAFGDLYPKLNLNEEADSIVRLIDGDRSAVRIAVESDVDRFNIYKLLLALKRLGLIGVVGEQEPADEREAETVPWVATAEDEPEARTVVDETLEPVVAIPSETEPPAIEPDETPPYDERVAFPSFVIDEPGTAATPEPDHVLAVEAGGVVPPSRGAWRIPLLLAVSIVALAAASYLISILRREAPVAAPGARQQASGPIARAVATPPAIIIEATPAPTAEMPPSVPTETIAEVPSPTPAVTVTPRPSPRPSATPMRSAAAPGVIIAKLHTTPNASPAVEAQATELPQDPARARIDSMAEEFARAAVPKYSVQFGIFCKPQSLEKALATDAANVWFVPAIFRGQPCYRAYWGRFDGRPEAEEAATRLPQAFREGTRPSVVSPGGR